MSPNLIMDRHHLFPSSPFKQIQSMKERTACLATELGGSLLPSPTKPVFPKPEKWGSWKRFTALHLVKPEEKLPGKSCGHATPRGHSWENKLAVSIAHLPDQWLGLGLNLSTQWFHGGGLLKCHLLGQAPL